MPRESPLPSHDRDGKGKKKQQREISFIRAVFPPPGRKLSHSHALKAPPRVLHWR